MAEDKPHESAAELLGDWRAARRDTISAKDARKVAELALVSASAAEEAALETEAAAEAALEAATRAQRAAERARRAAAQASEAAQILAATAEGDKVRINQVVAEAEEAETKARDAFHDAEGKGFPKADPGRPGEAGR